jgi:hypothetical protein
MRHSGEFFVSEGVKRQQPISTAVLIWSTGQDPSSCPILQQMLCQVNYEQCGGYYRMDPPPWFKGSGLWIGLGSVWIGPIPVGREHPAPHLPHLLSDLALAT